MGPAVSHALTLAALLTAPQHPADTTTYADRSTAELVARAMARHHAQDSTVRDYQAKIRYRLTFSLGKRRWASVPVAAAEEQEATVHWHAPNDIRVDLLGRREASRMKGVQLASGFDRPWFVPRTLSDSIRIFGSDVPAQAAPHPFAPGAEALYRYAAGDSVRVSTGGRTVTIRSVTVTPKQVGGSFVAGHLWVDVATGDVARITVRFVGTELWDSPDGATHEDSVDARRANKLASRILQVDADLEYGLQDRLYWMPYRQVLSGRAVVPFGYDLVVPFKAVTTFDDYIINSNRSVVFDAPFPTDTTEDKTRVTRRLRGDTATVDPRSDSLYSNREWRDSMLTRDRTGFMAGGGRFQIHRPPLDSMRHYQGWGDSIALDESDADRHKLEEATADLAALAEGLDPRLTGRAGTGFAWERAADILRYNRVEGTTLSLSGRTRAPVSFTDLFGTVRVGLADERVMARGAAVRDAPGGRLTVALSRDLADIDPFSRGLTFGNSIRGIFTGHDDGAYLLAQGGRVTFESSLDFGTELTLGALVEDQRSVSTEARSGIPRIFGSDGRFPRTDPVREGFATGLQLRLDHGLFGTRWNLSAEALRVDGANAARLAAELKLPRAVVPWAGLRLKGGIATGADDVPQLGLNLGGINTVRGYDFASARGDAMWAAQLDLTQPRGALRLALFGDIGQAGSLDRWNDARLLAGVGAGVSFFGGLMRAELSHPLTHGEGIRFDFVFGGLR